MAVLAVQREGGTLTIPNAGTESDILDLAGTNLAGVWGLTIYAPATLPETVNPKVAPVAASVAVTADFKTLQSGGSDIAVAAGKAVNLTEIVSKTFRLVATAGVGAERVFQYSARLRV